MSTELRMSIDLAIEAGRRYAEARKYLPLSASNLVAVLDKERHDATAAAQALAKKESQ